jgi:methylmalonyl-CoA mutase N-terminal domain/subunit
LTSNYCRVEGVAAIDVHREPADAARGSWQTAYDASTPRAERFETMSGIPVDAVYGDEPYPGQFPYTRGLFASMYRSKLWTMRMFAGFGTAEDTNRRFKELLRSGVTGLSTAFDMPTLMGRDSDDDWSVGEVGRAGVAVDTLTDMHDLFADVDLGSVSTSMTRSCSRCTWRRRRSVGSTVAASRERCRTTS